MMRAAVLIILMIFTTAGCAGGPTIKNGELYFDKDTSAGIEDLGVGRLNRKF